MLRRFPAAAAAFAFVTGVFPPGAAASTELGHPLLQDFPPKAYRGEAIHFCGVQDPSGRLYFGTSGPLHTYDGVTWSTVPLEGNAFETRALAVAPDGTIYVGAIDVLGRLRETPDGRKFESLRDRLPAGARDLPPILRAAAIGDTVCFATRSSLLLWRHETFTLIPQPDAPRRIFTADGAIYVLANKQPLYRVDGDQLVKITDDPRLDGIVALGADDHGVLSAVTSVKGLFRLEGGTVIPQPSELDGHWSENQVLNGRRLPDGSWALALRPESGGGILFLGNDGKFLNRLDETNGLPRPVAYNLAADREDGLWLCLLNGLARVEAPAAFTMFDRTNGLAGVIGDLARHGGVLWVATAEGLFRLEPGTAPRMPAHFERVQSGNFFAVVSDGPDLLAASARGLVRVTPTGITRPVPLDYGVVSLRRSTRDPDRLWLGTTHGLHSARRTADGWSDEGALPGLDGPVRSIAEEDDGSLWLGVTGQGFVRAKFSGAMATKPGAATFETFQATHGLPVATAQPTVATWRGHTVFTGLECGQFRFDGATDRFTPLEETAGLPRDLRRYGPVLGTDRPDHLWMLDVSAEAYGLWQASPGAPPRPLLHVLSVAAGYPRSYLEETTPEGDVLWVGGEDALLRVVVAQAWPTSVPFTTFVQANGLRAGDRVPPGRNAFDFEVSAPRFKSAGYRRHATRLVGYEPAFTPWTEEHKRSFTNLPPGHYRFEARTIDPDYQLSSVGALDFTLLAPWWRSWWFIGLASASGVGAVAGVTRWFASRALRRRIALLEAQTAVERERLRLARDLHDEVGSGLGRVILFAGEASRHQAEPAKLAAALGRIRDSAQELVQHAREIVWAVSPQHDTLASLVERLGDYVEETLRAAGIACRLDLPAELPAVAVGSEVRHSLFLALKESVHNCVKYSGAKSAAFSLHVAHGWLTLVLHDEGRGFATGERRGTGHGARNLAIRAAALGGTAAIASAPGQGTTVTIRVPLRPAGLP